jgi:RES domain-containing protein
LIEVWRITRRQFVEQAFSGNGARLYGGRWNHPGVPLVYTAQSRSLAILELLVHIRKTAPFEDFVLISAAFDEALIDTVEVRNLPTDWDAEPPTQATQSLGDDWAAAAKLPVLSVPSAVVPEERNYLLNPAHPLYSRIAIGSPMECRIDHRLI